MQVKICGVTDPQDAYYAASVGSDFIGMIFSPLSKRYISLNKGMDIAEATRSGGAEPVAVFVNETQEQIHSYCQETKIRTIQLHGPVSQQALPQLLKHYTIIYATTPDLVRSSSEILASFFLFDVQGGSGYPFDWKSFSPPSTAVWFLAGGLNPDNILQALSILRPHGVDVATGVEYPYSTRKKPALVKDFIQKAKHTQEVL